MSAPTAIHGGTAPLAALTSVFTPPCPTTWLLTTTRLLSQYPTFPRRGPESCDPPSWSSNIAGAGFHFYSPAICPDGFVVGPSCGLTKTRTNEGFPAIAPGETAVYCVPSGLTCTTDTTDFRGGVWGFARRATTSGALVTVGPALQIRWVEADLTALETHPLTPGLRFAVTEESPRVTSTAERIRTTLARESSRTSMSSATSTSVPVRTLPTMSLLETVSTSPGGQETTATTGSRIPTPNFDGTIDVTFETADPTTSADPLSSNVGGEEEAAGGIGSLDRGASIAIIVVVTVAAGILVWMTAFLLIRRRKGRQGVSPVSAKEGGEAGLGPRGGANMNWATRKAMALSPISELDAGIPARLGSTPNPAELEGDAQLATKPWMHQRSWLRSPSFNYHQNSPRSIQSSRSIRRTIRESFGEKVNDPATALGRLNIPTALGGMSRSSPTSASPKTGGFWRLPRSPRSPAGASRLSQQWPKP
ncbi:Mid2 domain-containing protein [Madurella fahalii]|uniref:Mid2 domain-containing protein n=1 Tax=Madurella fahalii TaxID=1157608 RepID=A0ABQ0GPM5_9PEZI